MKTWILSLITITFAQLVLAGGLSETEAGVYVVLDKAGKHSDLLYKLHFEKGKWSAESKEGVGPWKPISCTKECKYESTSDSESSSYLPAEMKSSTLISCIRNKAGAFCKYQMKADTSKGGYVMITFVTGKQIPVFMAKHATDK